jgi:hypothetical protein
MMNDDEQDGITAYHGSPHDFDQFQLEKIGTGEGAQAYGHGLYFAENPEVARGYRSALEKPTHPKIGDEWLSDVHDQHMSAGENDKALALELLHDKGDILGVRQRSDLLKPETMDWFEKEIAPNVTRQGGKLYQVRLKARPEHFLDWDAPMSEQSEFVRNAIGSKISGHEPVGNAIGRAHRNELFAGDIIGKDRATPAELTAYLASLGIRGIRYFDAGSRGKGEGSRNYVVFDPQHIEVVRKYKRGGDVRAGKAEGGVDDDGAMKAPPVFTNDLINRALEITRVGNPMQPARSGVSTTRSNLSSLVHRPIEEMSASYVPVGDLMPEQSVSWEHLQGGHLIPAVGDRTMGGHALTRINDKDLSFYPSLEGGYDFMRSKAAQADKAAWASGKGVITSLGKLIRDTAEKGKPIYFAHSSMSGESGDFSHMMTDALLAQIIGAKISKKAKKAFDEDMRNIKEVGDKWPGIDHPKIREYLYSHGPSRYWFGKTVDKREHRNAGFPDAASTRYAITAGDLINTPSGNIGRAISELDPTGEAITDPKHPHSTYPVQLRGVRYIGRPEAALPREIAFPKWTAARREAKANPLGDERSFNLGRFSEPIDQQWIDGVMKFLEERKRRG